MKGKFYTLLLTLFLVNIGSLATAEVSVIVGSNSTIDSIDVATLKRLYLGKTETLPDGTLVEAVELSNEKTKERFHKKVTSKSIRQLSAYWARLIFTGKGKPKHQIEDPEELIDYISSNTNAIGYIETSSASSARVKTILLIQ